MSLVLKTAPVDPPVSNDDWTRTQALITMLFLGNNGPIIRIVGSDIVKGSVFQIGGAIYYADSDTAISGVASDYVKITPAGATASAEFVADLSAALWSDEYNGWIDSSGNLYIFDEGLALAAGEISECHERYLRINSNGSVNIANITEANITEANITEANIGNVFPYGFGSLTGNQLSIAGITSPALAALISTPLQPYPTVAFIDSTIEKLSTYTWNGTNWTLKGNQLSIAGIGYPAIVALSPTTVALIDNGLEKLSTYTWNGTNWTLKGNQLSIAGIGYPALAALNSTTIAFIDSTLEKLSTYTWDGTDWTLTGNQLSIAGIGFSALTAIDSTHIAFIDEGLEKLSTYTWNGTDWTLTGNQLSISGAGFPAIVALNSTTVALIDNILEKLSTYTWNGTDWTLTGNQLSISGIGAPALAKLNSTTVALIDDTIEKLSTYTTYKLLT